MDFNWLKKFKRIYTNFQLKQFAIDGIFLVKNGVRIYFSQKIVQANFFKLNAQLRRQTAYLFLRVFFIHFSFACRRMIVSAIDSHSIDHSTVLRVSAYDTLFASKPIEIYTSPCLCTFQLLIGFVVFIEVMN